jgi:hypothetical protein
MSWEIPSSLLKPPPVLLLDDAPRPAGRGAGVRDQLGCGGPNVRSPPGGPFAAVEIIDRPRPQANRSSRRISPVAAHSGDRLLSETTADTQPCRRETAPRAPQQTLAAGQRPGHAGWEAGRSTSGSHVARPEHPSRIWDQGDVEEISNWPQDWIVRGGSSATFYPNSWHALRSALSETESAECDLAPILAVLLPGSSRL